MDDLPVIMVVDDRPHGLTALRDAIARRYSADYRVVGHTSAGEALAELARAGEVALVIADQWMPEMTGRELLERAHALHPGAQRALLVGWGDTRANETILQGCARGQLDNYLLKPWTPAEVHLYPFIGEFLTEWVRQHRPQLEVIRVVGAKLLPRSRELLHVLERNAVPHGYYDAETRDGRELMARWGVDPGRLPALVLLDGRVLHDPSSAQIADLFGVSELGDPYCDLAIIGAGPCGLSAAVGAGSEGLRTLVVERDAIGGQASASSLIRNFLGFPRGITGAELAQRAYQQAWLFGAKFGLVCATGLRSEGDRRVVTLADGRELFARAVLVATGVEYRRLDVPRIDRFEGIGVFYSAGGDIALALRGEDVVVYGGGNSAGQAVVYLAKTARRVIHCVRGPALSQTMSAYLVDEISRLPNVELRLNTEVVDGDGERGLGQVTLRERKTGQRTIVRTPALFVMIGASPHTEWLEGAIDRDRNGFILTGADLRGRALRGFESRAPMLVETSMPGVFAAGDVRFGSTKRLAAAVGEAGVAVRVIHDYLALAPHVDVTAFTQPRGTSFAAPS
jgi:thioredoxin reductase (NADPH)